MVAPTSRYESCYESRLSNAIWHVNMSSNIRRFFMQLCKRPSRVHFGVGIVGRVETSLGNDSKRVPPKIHSEIIPSSPPLLYIFPSLSFSWWRWTHPFRSSVSTLYLSALHTSMITINTIPLKSVDQCPNVYYDRMIIVILRFPSFLTLINRSD